MLAKGDRGSAPVTSNNCKVLTKRLGMMVHKCSPYSSTWEQGGDKALGGCEPHDEAPSLRELSGWLGAGWLVGK